MTDTKQVMQQALDALCLPCDRWNGEQTKIINAAIEALRGCLTDPAAEVPEAMGDADTKRRKACLDYAAKHPVVLEIMSDCAHAIDTESASFHEPGEWDSQPWWDLSKNLKAEAEAIRAEDPEIWPQLVEQSTRLRGGVPTEAQIVAAARTLNKLSANSCNVDEADQWALYGNTFRAEAKAALTSALTAAPQAPALDADPLQGAANWIVSATSYDRATHIAEIQQRLLIGYNRASRLYDAAMSAQGASQAERDQGGR